MKQPLQLGKMQKQDQHGNVKEIYVTAINTENGPKPLADELENLFQIIKVKQGLQTEKALAIKDVFKLIKMITESFLAQNNHLEKVNETIKDIASEDREVSSSSNKYIRSISLNSRTDQEMYIPSAVEFVTEKIKELAQKSPTEFATEIIAETIAIINNEIIKNVKEAEEKLN